MSDHYIQLPSTELAPIFKFAKDCFLRSNERFTGDVTEFNRNGNNDFFIALNRSEVGYIYVWKTGVVNKMIRDLQQKVTIPVHDFIILQTPANGSYPWHNEGMKYTELATDKYREVARVMRRPVALNYPLDNADLSKSKIEWATPSDKTTELLIAGYSNIMNSANSSQNYTDDHINLRSQNKTHHIGWIQRTKSFEALELDPKEIADILNRSHDSGEGVRINSILSIVYDNHNELLTEVDEYYGMPEPTLIRTDQWHRIINAHVEEDRNMGSISFDPTYSYSDIKTLIMNNEFIK